LKRCAFLTTQWWSAFLLNSIRWECGRANTSWEAIALSAGVDLEHLLGAALVAHGEHAKTMRKLIAMSHYQEIVKQRIEYAKLPGGWRDRDALDKLLGLLPITISLAIIAASVAVSLSPVQACFEPTLSSYFQVQK